MHSVHLACESSNLIAFQFFLIKCNNSMCIFQVDFHDTGRGPRVPSMTDYFGFTMAALNESGCVFANPCKGDKSMSTLMYRPFGSWAGNSEVCYLQCVFWLYKFNNWKYLSLQLSTLCENIFYVQISGQ